MINIINEDEFSQLTKTKTDYRAKYPWGALKPNQSFTVEATDKAYRSLSVMVSVKNKIEFGKRFKVTKFDDVIAVTRVE